MGAPLPNRWKLPLPDEVEAPDGDMGGPLLSTKWKLPLPEEDGAPDGDMVWALLSTRWKLLIPEEDRAPDVVGAPDGDGAPGVGRQGCAGLSPSQITTSAIGTDLPG